jgi:hypothetical protein
MPDAARQRGFKRHLFIGGDPGARLRCPRQ